jgi:hypothetical protein
MLGRDWILLVAGTLLGVISLTADLVGLGAFRGFGWKQVVGTTAALALVISTGWRIYRASREAPVTRPSAGDPARRTSGRHGPSAPP